MANSNTERLIFMKFSDEITVKGSVHVQVFRGKTLIEGFGGNNMIVYGGRVRLAQLISGESSNSIVKLGVGTGDKVPEENDNSLTDAEFFNCISRRVEGANAIFEFEIKENECNGKEICEFGLFTSDEVMFSRRVRGGYIKKDEDLSISIKWILHF